MKSIKLAFRTKHTERLVFNKCLASLTEEDAENIGSISSTEDVKDSEGLREVTIEFELNNENHFLSEFSKLKIYKDITNLELKYNVEPIDWKLSLDRMFE